MILYPAHTGAIQVKLNDHDNAGKIAMELTLKFIDYDSKSLDNPRFEKGYKAMFAIDGEVFSCDYPAGLFDEDTEIGIMRDYTLHNAEVSKPS